MVRQALRAFFAATAAIGIVSTSAAAQTSSDAPPAAIGARIGFSLFGSAVKGGPPVILYAGSPLPQNSPAQAPFRDTDNILCVAPASLSPLGIGFRVEERGRIVALSAQNGQTVRVAARYIGDELFVPVVEATQSLGGKCQWNALTGVLTIRARITGVEMNENRLTIRSSFPVTAKIGSLNSGTSVFVDIAGAEIGSLPKVLPLEGANINQARSGQFNEDTARIVLELRQSGNYTVIDSRPSAQLILFPTSYRPSAPTPNADRPIVAAKKPMPVKPASKPSKLAVVSDIRVQRISDSRVQIVLKTGGAPGVRANMDGGQLRFDLLNTTLSAGAIANLAGAQHPLLRAVQAFAPTGSAARVVVDLSRVVTYTVKPGKGSLILDLSLPRGAFGTLAGKTVIVDPGHGGSDAGARGVNGTWEKNVTLAISNRLADVLRDGGANVIMTRSNDAFIPLDTRALIANRADADFFLAVHADSVPGNRHHIHGSTVYYHKSNAPHRALAQCIAAEFGRMGGISTKGTRSDGQIYSSGFAVLRNTRMVGVLVETGYMTNPGDVQKLNSPSHQQKIAEAIARGLQNYIEGNPLYNTRGNNAGVADPGVEGELQLSPGASPSANPFDPESPLPPTPATR